MVVLVDRGGTKGLLTGPGLVVEGILATFVADVVAALLFTFAVEGVDVVLNDCK